MKEGKQKGNKDSKKNKSPKQKEREDIIQRTMNIFKVR